MPVAWMLVVWLCSDHGCQETRMLHKLTAARCIETRAQLMVWQGLPDADGHWIEARCEPDQVRS